MYATQYHYVYIATNDKNTRLNLGTAGDIRIRAFYLYEASSMPKEQRNSNVCTKLVFWERFENINAVKALYRKLNLLPKRKLADFVDTHNPEWQSLNKQVFDLPDFLLNFHLLNPKLKIQTQ